MPSFLQSRARMVRLVVIAIAVLALLLTGYYQVEPDEVAVVQRFGKFVRSTDPGPHVKIPFGVETVTKVPVKRTLKMEFGFRTVRPGIHTEFAPPSEETRAESIMFTGDLNVAVVEWTVQFRIKDPRQFLFDVRDVPKTFRDMSEAVMREVVGDHSVDEVITIGRDPIAIQAKEQLQKLCDRYGIGIDVQQLVLQNVNPPDAVKPAFMRPPLHVIAAAVVLVLLFSSVYTVSETEQAILVQFGMPVGGLVKDPGLHLKVPFIQDVHRFDKCWLEFDAAPREVPTKDKKYIWVDAYARWRIVDPLRFYEAVGDERGAQSRLDDVIHGQTRNAVASFDLIELVRSSDRPFQITEGLEGIGAAEVMAKIMSGREKIAQIVLKRAAEMTPPTASS